MTTAHPLDDSRDEDLYLAVLRMAIDSVSDADKNRPRSPAQVVAAFQQLLPLVLTGAPAGDGTLTLQGLQEQLMTIQESINRLQGEVAEAKTIAEGAVAFSRGQAQIIKDLSDRIASGELVDVAAVKTELDTLSDTLDASTNALAEAISLNVPPPEPAPPVEPPANPEGENR